MIIFRQEPITNTPLPSNAHFVAKRHCVIIFCFFSLCCTKKSTAPEYIPSTYQDMFIALNLQFDVTYKYVERINNSESGNSGTIKFSLRDTSMTESFNSKVTKDFFRLDSMQAYSAKFENLGFNKYSASESVFINSARQTISFVNGRAMVSFGLQRGGSYYFYQYLFSK